MNIYTLSEAQCMIAPKILIEIKMNNRHIYSNGLENQGLSVEVIIQ